MKTRIARALFLLLMFPALGWSQLYFPRLVSSSELGTTGYAVVNPSSTAADVTFTMFSSAGVVVGSYTQSIAAGGQLARLGSELFSSAPGGWVRATSTVPLQGFWLGGDFSSYTDGAAAADAATDQVFPLVAGQTEINIANPGSSSNTITIRILDASGTDLASAANPTIVPGGAIQIQTAALFPSADLSQARHLRMTGTAPFAATSVIREFLVSTESAVLNSVSVSTAPNVLNFPHVVNGVIGTSDYATTLGVTNLASSAQSVTLTFRPEPDGAPISVQRSLPAGGSLREPVQSLFSLLVGFQDGWVQVTGTSAITGFVAYAETSAGGLAVVPVQGSPESTMMFAHIAGQPTWYSGLALLNTGTVDANVEVYTMNPSGALIGGAQNVPTAALTLRAGHKVAKLLSELVPATATQNGGFVFVRTTGGPVYAMELFGSLDGRILANVGAAGLPQNLTYTPPAAPAPGSVASISVTPGAAMVAVGGSQTFTAVARDAQGTTLTGASFTWQSSAPAVATVSDNGVASGVSVGQTSITASSGGITSASASLSVTGGSSGPPSQGTPTSEALIQAAVESGLINAETALTYRIFASFSDPRLPAQYQGDDSAVREPLAIWDLDAQFSSLSAETQELLLPYLIRPDSVGSWTNAPAVGPDRLQAFGPLADDRPTCRGETSGWTTAGPTTSKVRVWYPFAVTGAKEKAEAVSAAIEGPIWSALIDRLQFPRPISDTSIFGCFGGDARLDIYIVYPSRAPNWAGITVPDGSSSPNKKTSFILLNGSRSLTEIPQTAAHEFMHMSQFAQAKAADMTSYGWMMDAMADWAIDAVWGNDPQHKLEHESAPCYMIHPELPLDDRSAGGCGVPRDYGAYVFFQFVAKTLGETFVKSTLDATFRNSRSLDAVDETLTKGFKEQWPKFARAMWNEDPVKTYKTWDAMTTTPALVFSAVFPADLLSRPSLSIALGTRLKKLSAVYYHFKMEDERTRSVMFNNTFYQNRQADQKVNVQALWKVENGGWAEEDWTNQEWIGFCRDMRALRITDLVVIISNADKDNEIVAAKEPTLKSNNIGCWGFKGTATRTTVDRGQWEQGGKVTVKAEVTFASSFAPLYTDPSTGRLRVMFTGPLFTDGNITITEDYRTTQGCRHVIGPRSFPVTSVVQGGSTSGLMFLHYFNEALPDDVRANLQEVIGTTPRRYWAVGATDQQVRGTIIGDADKCGPDLFYFSDVAGWLVVSDDPAKMPLVDNQGHLRDSYLVPDNGKIDDKYEWDLEPIREPDPQP